MFCTNCGCPCREGRCPICGAPAAPMPPRLNAPAKNRSRTPILILAIMALVGLIVFLLMPYDQPSADPGSPVQDGCFILQEGILSFDESRYDGSSVLEIPALVDGQTVTAISAGCFRDLEGVTAIILPDTLERIYDRAFSGCTDLRGMQLPLGCKSIGNDAFADCVSMEAIHVPNTVTYIGDGAFAGCRDLQYIFYEGKYSDWKTMYPDEISLLTWVICRDGEYRQGMD